MGYREDIERIVSKTIPDLVWQTQLKIVFDLDARVVFKTPVDTGRARSNWLPGVNTPVRATSDSLAKPQLPLVIKPFSIFYLSNNLPYILPLEEGSSKQAPQGMAAISVRETARAFQ